jgi:hypothetical protein
VLNFFTINRDRYSYAATDPLLQQIIDERISFLKEQINPCNKPEENRTFQLQIEAIRYAASAGDIKEVEAIIAEKKALLKISNDIF